MTAHMANAVVTKMRKCCFAWRCLRPAVRGLKRQRVSENRAQDKAGLRNGKYIGVVVMIVGPPTQPTCMSWGQVCGWVGFELHKPFAKMATDERVRAISDLTVAGTKDKV